MTTPIIKGRTGEQLAVEYLLEHGFSILYRNWTSGHFEIDIIACKKDVLHIVEVKTRHSNSFGRPEEAVSKKKFRNLQFAAERFMDQYPCWKYLEFDILSITRSLQGDQYLWIDDVYL